jgi:hypothetical protein
VNILNKTIVVDENTYVVKTRREKMKENKRKEETEEVNAFCLSADDFDHIC